MEAVLHCLRRNCFLNDNDDDDNNNNDNHHHHHHEEIITTTLHNHNITNSNYRHHNLSESHDPLLYQPPRHTTTSTTIIHDGDDNDNIHNGNDDAQQHNQEGPLFITPIKNFFQNFGGSGGGKGGQNERGRRRRSSTLITQQEEEEEEEEEDNHSNNDTTGRLPMHHDHKTQFGFIPSSDSFPSYSSCVSSPLHEAKSLSTDTGTTTIDNTTNNNIPTINSSEIVLPGSDLQKQMSLSLRNYLITTNQHNNNNNNIQYEEDECVICMETFTPDNPRIPTSCGCGLNKTYFHLPCLYHWMEQSSDCPSCRKKLIWQEF